MSVVFAGSEASPAHSRSGKVSDSSLDLFTVPPTNISFNSYRIVEVNPTSESTTPVEFVLPGSREFIDFKRSYFRIEVSFADAADDGNLVSGDNIVPVNNLFHSMNKQPSIYVNGTLTTEQTDTYPFKAYLETILNYGTEDEETFLKCQGYFPILNYPDPISYSPNKIDTAHADYKALVGEDKDIADKIRTTRESITGGKVLQLFGMPHADLLNSGRMLIPGVDLKMRFTLNKPAFYMNRLSGSTKVPKVKSFSMKFYPCMVKIRSDIYNYIASQRLEGNKDIFYPTVRSEVRTFTHPNRDTAFHAADVFLGRLPHRVFVALVYQKGFTGDLDYNPFNFVKHKISSIKQIIEGEEYPYPTLELDPANGNKDMEGYHRLVVSNCCKFKGRCMIKPEHWGQDKHCTIFMFDNVASGCANSLELKPRQEGRVNIHFRNSEVDELMTVIVYGEFENTVEINPTGSTQYDIYGQTVAGRNPL